MIERPRLTDALLELRPEGGYNLYDDGTIEFFGDEKWNKPTLEETKIKHAEMLIEYDAQEYARKRKAEYPELAEQLDYIFHNGITKWKSDMIKPVKDKYSKG